MVSTLVPCRWDVKHSVVYTYACVHVMVPLESLMITLPGSVGSITESVLDSDTSKNSSSSTRFRESTKVVTGTHTRVMFGVKDVSVVKDRYSTTWEERMPNFS